MAKIGMIPNKIIETDAKIKKINKKIAKHLKKINVMFAKSDEKVAYYFEEIDQNIIFSYNANITFYAASTIKLLAALYCFDNNCNLNETLTITKEDIKNGSGIICKENELPKTYKLEELLEYIIRYSDNTAYIKVVNYIGKENLIAYGQSLGAKHTLEGKDLFGITNCSDLKCYWQRFYEIDVPKLKDWLETPVYKIIKHPDFDKYAFCRKYGSFGIAYHETGIALDKHPYYLIILTQKSQSKKSQKFINKVAKELIYVHHLLQEE